MKFCFFLLRPYSVSDNLEDVLHIVSDKAKKTASKEKPRSHAPGTESTKPGGLFDEGPDLPEMGTDDIMKYITSPQQMTIWICFSSPFVVGMSFVVCSRTP